MMSSRQSEEPPVHLGAEAADLWRAVIADYELDRPALVLLEALCDAWERYAQARSVLAAEGPFVEGRYGPKAHPAVAVERDSRVMLARLVRELDLEGLPIPEPKRPPRRGG
jgi:P27 family predicted phage terminase small subunit